MIAVIMVFFLFIGKLPDDSATLESTLYNNAVIAVVINAIICSLTEAYVLFQHWKKTTIESERLHRETAESKYAALKNQVNPHFLFNSLNSLSSLIRVSPDKAIEFVDKFSKIYRYVLDSTEKILIELREELIFLQSYIYLQKIRFGDNLLVDINIDANYLNDFIPPLALQLLVENALKHNEVSTEFPLKITIEVVDTFLVVTNNLQLKKSMEQSTGIGIKNLEDRYNQFSEFKPVFMATADKYIAKIPLIKEVE
jgi:LytS/YehU family sensor histidine kinase